MDKPWRVVMFSVAPSMATLVEQIITDKGHKLVGIVTAPGPRTRRTNGYREVAQLARPGLDVIVSNYPHRWAAMIAPLKPDLLVCVSFNWKLPGEVLNVPPLGAINGHDGLLPRYRGLNATGWALRNDEPTFGVTVHYMTPELDDGAILAQRAIPITDDDDRDTLIGAFIQAGQEVYREALDRIARGDRGVPQCEADAYTTPGLFEEDWLHIDWSKPARDIHVQVRSWHGTRDQPRGALGELDGVLTRVTKTRLTREDNDRATATPGTILRRDDDSLLIQCGDRPLQILQWQPESSFLESFTEKR